MTPSTLRSKDPTGVRPYRVSAYLPYIWLAPEYPRCLIEKHATSIEKKKEKKKEKKTAHPAWSIVRARQVTWKLGVEFQKCCTGGPRLVPCPGKNCWRTKCSKNTTVFVRNDKLRIVVQFQQRENTFILEISSWKSFVSPCRINENKIFFLHNFRLVPPTLDISLSLSFVSNYPFRYRTAWPSERHDSIRNSSPRRNFRIHHDDSSFRFLLFSPPRSRDLCQI